MSLTYKGQCLGWAFRLNLLALVVLGVACGRTGGDAGIARGVASDMPEQVAAYHEVLSQTDVTLRRKIDAGLSGAGLRKAIEQFNQERFLMAEAILGAQR